MSLNADTLIDRSYLKGQIAKWRVIAIIVTVLSVILFVEKLTPLAPHGNYIARVTIDGVIIDDIRRDALFNDLAENKNVKAIILRMDSPGGTVVGGEQLYLNVKKLAAVKPVVVTMRSMATSAGYMATLGASRIFAREGTLTASIGVIMQTAEVTELASKLGINPITLKSGPNKAAPNPFEKLSDESRAQLQDTIMDFYRIFVDMVVEGRKLPREKVLELADGRVLTGPQALKVGLVDALGGEEEAISWLQKEKKIDASLEVVDREPEREGPKSLADFFKESASLFTFLPEIRLDGLVSIWQPRAI